MRTALLMQWVRAVATALLAAVVARLVLTPSGALVALPLWLRLGAVVGGVAVFALAKRSVLAGVVAAEAILVGGAWGLGVPALSLERGAKPGGVVGEHVGLFHLRLRRLHRRPP